MSFRLQELPPRPPRELVKARAFTAAAADLIDHRSLYDAVLLTAHPPAAAYLKCRDITSLWCDISLRWMIYYGLDPDECPAVGEVVGRLRDAPQRFRSDPAWRDPAGRLASLALAHRYDLDDAPLFPRPFGCCVRRGRQKAAMIGLTVALGLKLPPEEVQL
jgi:hypothetical protein